MQQNNIICHFCYLTLNVAQFFSYLSGSILCSFVFPSFERNTVTAFPILTCQQRIEAFQQTVLFSGFICLVFFQKTFFDFQVRFLKGLLMFLPPKKYLSHPTAHFAMITYSCRIKRINTNGSKSPW